MIPNYGFYFILFFVRFALTNDTPYLALTGALWGVFLELYEDKWPRYIESALYLCIILFVLSTCNFISDDTFGGLNHHFLYIYKSDERFIIPPKTKFRGGILDSPCSSVRLSVRPSVRPWVGVRMITLILFSGFKNFFLHISLGSRSCMGLNMRILADHVTYSFLAFPKSIF